MEVASVLSERFQSNLRGGVRGTKSHDNGLSIRDMTVSLETDHLGTRIVDKVFAVCASLRNFLSVGRSRQGHGGSEFGAEVACELLALVEIRAGHVLVTEYRVQKLANGDDLQFQEVLDSNTRNRIGKVHTSPRLSWFKKPTCTRRSCRVRTSVSCESSDTDAV